MARLSESDLARPVLQAAARKLKGREGLYLKYRRGACPFLDLSTDKCKIYENRPEACRSFSCRSAQPSGPFLIANPLVRAILEQSPA